MAGEITTALTELKKRQTELATNLTAMGQPTDVSEPLDVQIPKVLNIQGGGGAVVSKDVNFYDYDGTLIAGWTLAQAQTATQLPEGLTHDRLIFDGWNWSLEDINALKMPMDIGAMYVTESGATEIDVVFTNVTGRAISIYIANTSTSSNTITVQWGDGTVDSITLAISGMKLFSHTFSTIGNYTISVDGTAIYYLYSSSTVSSMFNTAINYTCVAVRTGLRAIFSGGGRVFYQCYNLETVTMSSHYEWSTLGGNVFNGARSLKFLTVPPSVNSIPTYAFQGTYNLKGIACSSNLTTIASYAFYNSYTLRKITIPSTVTNIGTYAFHTCYCIRKYVFHSTTPPVLESTSIFTNINTSCIMSLLPEVIADYKEATNWTAYINYMEEWEGAA